VRLGLLLALAGLVPFAAADALIMDMAWLPAGGERRRAVAEAGCLVWGAVVFLLVPAGTVLDLVWKRCAWVMMVKGCRLLLRS
jgi:hypothetical protein